MIYHLLIIFLNTYCRLLPNILEVLLHVTIIATLLKVTQADCVKSTSMSVWTCHVTTEVLVKTSLTITDVSVWQVTQASGVR